MFGDAGYLQSVLDMLPGVDPNDPAVQSTLRSLQGGNADKEEDGTEDPKNEPQ
jgi:hypothetical protein